MTKFYVPSKAFLNEEVNLTCRYELSNELLYTMKLFKDNQEVSGSIQLDMAFNPDAN